MEQVDDDYDDQDEYDDHNDSDDDDDGHYNQNQHASERFIRILFL